MELGYLETDGPYLIRNRPDKNPPYDKVGIFYPPSEDKVCLDIGAGILPLPGFEHVDVQPLAHIEHVVDLNFNNLPFKENSVDMIYSSHFIEHLPYRRLPDVLANWNRVLKPGGTLELHFPDLIKIVSLYQRHPDHPLFHPDFSILGHLYGNQHIPEEVHNACYSEDMIVHLLDCIGFQYIQLLPNHIDEVDGVIGAVK